MRRRALALLLVALLAGGAWLLRDNGILLGRDSDGPLEGGFGHSSGPFEPGNTAYLVTGVTADGHVVESVGFDRVSPGLKVMGPVVFDRPFQAQMTEIRRWPPHGTRPFRDIEVKRRTGIGFGARATEPGIYHVAGVRYRYRKGLRRFDEVDDTALCLQFVERLVNHCPDTTDVASFEGLAEIGGPADYRDALWEGTKRFPFDGDGPTYRMKRGGTLEFVITISNLSGEDREVPRLDLGRSGAGRAYRDKLDPLPSVPPAPFTIPAGGSREVRVRARFSQCDQYRSKQSTTYDAIEAGDDDVELSLPVRVSGPCR